MIFCVVNQGFTYHKYPLSPNNPYTMKSLKPLKSIRSPRLQALPYSGYFSRGVYFVDFAQRAQSANFEIIESGCGQLECSLLPCALKKASLLSSSGGPLSRPRRVPSSFVASVKACYCPNAPNAGHGNYSVVTSALQRSPSPSPEAFVDAVSMKAGVINFTAN